MTNSQLQSPLFRLPRELRDQIYEAVFYHEDGLCFDFPSQRLFCQTKEWKRVNFSLAISYTCKRIAHETKGVALAPNTITFTTGLSPDSRAHFNGLSSIAGRYQCLRTYTLMMNISILKYGAECITPEVIDKIGNASPDIKVYFEEPLRHAVAGLNLGRWQLQRGMGERFNIPLGEDFRKALEEALDLLMERSPAEFELLASNAFREHPVPRGSQVDDFPTAQTHMMPESRIHRPCFSQDSFRTLLSWKPPSWSIPDESDLSILEAYLMEPKRNIWDLDLVSDSLNTAWYFSAAAVAIKFLAGLKDQRYPRKVILEEDRKSVASPQNHLQGFLPFCAESKLLVERRIGLFTTMLPLAWSGIDRSRIALTGYVRGDSCLYAFALWIAETLSLPPSMRVILTADEETSRAWEFVKRAAGMQEAMMRYIQQNGIPQPSLFREERYWRFQYPLPCFLPSWFASGIRDIANRKSRIYFEGEIGETWNVDEILQNKGDWTLERWRDVWQAEFCNKIVELPDAWEDILKGYTVDPAFKRSLKYQEFAQESLLETQPTRRRGMLQA